MSYAVRRTIWAEMVMKMHLNECFAAVRQFVTNWRKNYRKIVAMRGCASAAVGGYIHTYPHNHASAANWRHPPRRIRAFGLPQDERPKPILRRRLDSVIRFAGDSSAPGRKRARHEASKADGDYRGCDDHWLVSSRSSQANARRTVLMREILPRTMPRFHSPMRLNVT